jgi:pyruvyltransferase
MRRLDVRAVRGPLTRLIMLDNNIITPVCYGDPAVIMPDIYQPESSEKEYDYGIILQHSENTNVDINNNELLISTRTKDYKSFINKMNQCRKIISSSLHGLIIAEAYGIPSVLLKPKGSLFKYYDYYYSTERMTFPVANTIEEAESIQPAALPNNFDFMKKNLYDSFPYDIFTEIIQEE